MSSLTLSRAAPVGAEKKKQVRDVSLGALLYGALLYMGEELKMDVGPEKRELQEPRP